MKLSTTLLATLACTQAIHIEANVDNQLDAEFWDDIVGGIDDALGAIGDVAIDIGDGIMDGIDFVGEGLDFLGDGIMDGIDAIGEGFEFLGDGLMDGIDAIGDGFSFVGDELEGFGSDVLDGFGDFGNMLGDGLGDFGDLLGDGFGAIGDGLGDFGDMLGDGFDSAIDWTVGAANDIADGLGDAWDWVSDGDNWAALGETLGTGALLAITGNFEQAGAVLGNDQMYSEQGRENMERERQEMIERERARIIAEKTHIAKLEACIKRRDAVIAGQANSEAQKEQIVRDKYDEYLQSFHDRIDQLLEDHQQGYADAKTAYDAERDPVIAQINQIKAQLATYREGDTEPAHHQFDVHIPSLGVTAQMNKTKRFSYVLGNRAADFIWTRIMDPQKVDKATCEQEDCLHRAYGTAMTAHCGICYDQIFKYKRALGNSQVQEALRGVCGKCEIPPVADPLAPAPYPNYTAPTDLPEAATFDVYRAQIIAQIEELFNPKPDSELTPEQLESRRATETFEAYCVEHSPEWQEAFL